MAEPEAIADVVFKSHGPAQRSCRRNCAGHGRRHARGARSGALHRQPLQRQDGLCAGRCGAEPRSQSDPGQRADRRCIRRHAAKWCSVTTAEEMRKAVLERMAEATMVIKAAAVADYRPVNVSDQKLKRTGPMTLELAPTEDILAEVTKQRRPGQLIVGFAAETAEHDGERPRQAAAQGRRRHRGQRCFGRRRRHRCRPQCRDVSHSFHRRSNCRRCPSASLPTASLTRLSRCAGRGRWFLKSMKARAAGQGSQRVRRADHLAPPDHRGVAALPALDPATREALEARLRFYRELGLTDFYRRPVDASSYQFASRIRVPQSLDPQIVRRNGCPVRDSIDVTGERRPFHPASLSKPLRRSQRRFHPPTAPPPSNSSAKISATARAARCTRAATRSSLPMATPTRA